MKKIILITLASTFFTNAIFAQNMPTVPSAKDVKQDAKQGVTQKAGTIKQGAQQDMSTVKQNGTNVKQDAAMVKQKSANTKKDMANVKQKAGTAKQTVKKPSSGTATGSNTRATVKQKAGEAKKAGADAAKKKAADEVNQMTK